MHHRVIKFYLAAAIIILALAAVSQAAAGGQTDIFSPEYKIGLALFKAGEFTRAADAWINTGKMFLKESRDRASLIKAALANVLATIALEKAGDARAYVAWSAAVRYFLEGQSNWEKERRIIRLAVDRIQSQLKAGATGGPLIGVRAEEFTTPDMEEALSVTSYDGPSPGLKVRRSQGETTITHVSRDYYPRPVIMAEKEEKEEKEEKRIIDHDSHRGTEEKTQSESYCPPCLGRGIPLPQGVSGKIAPVVSAGSGDSGIRPSGLKTAEKAPPLILRRHIVPVLAPTAPQGSTAAISSSRSEPAEEMLLPLDDSETRSKKERRDRAAALRAGTSIQEKQEDKIFEEAGKSSYRQVLLPRIDGVVKNEFSKECKEIARAAWRYFIYNYQPNTGMVNAVHNYPYATLWDMGSAQAGFIAAEKLSIISMKDFKGKTTQ